MSSAETNARPRSGVRRFGNKVLWVVSALIALVVFYFLFTFAQVWWSARQDDRRQSDAIVVLGAAQFDGKPSSVLAARLDHAIELYKEGVAPVIVVTGGGQPGDRFTEATSAANYLSEHDIPNSAILRETTSRSSWQSLAASARILNERGLDRVVLVSDPFHSERIRRTAEELGLDAVTSPTRSSPISGVSEFRYMVGETIRVGVGRFLGFRRVERGSRIGKLVEGGE